MPSIAQGDIVSRVLAFARSTGNGSASAMAEITAEGQIRVFAWVMGNAEAGAAGQANILGGYNPGMSVHIVQKGDNLYRIAIRYNTTVAVLSNLNGISDSSRIYPGQEIRLPQP
jgi:hypothetical protein